MKVFWLDSKSKRCDKKISFNVTLIFYPLKAGFLIGEEGRDIMGGR